jgi:hypothetical protein
MRLALVLTVFAVLVAVTPRPVSAQAAAAGQGAAQAPASSDQAAAIRAEVDKLRQEFQALRQQYDQRLSALESRLVTIEQGRGAQAGAAPTPAATPPPATPPAATPPVQAQPPVAGAEAPPAAPPAVTGTVPVPQGAPQPAIPGGEPGAAAGQSLPVYGNASALSKIFNPDIAVIGDFLGVGGHNPVETGSAFELHEAEVSYQAVVDPYARADFFLSFANGGVNVEEGYISFTSLPGGLLARVGEMRGAFGKVDLMHTHVLPWADRPLVIRNLAGGEDGIRDAGVSVQRLIPNPWLFLEATGQAFAGSSDVFHAWQRSDVSWVGHLRGYRDITESSNLDVGTSIAYGTNDIAPGLKTTLYGIDGTFRYRPLRRAIYRQFIGRTELIWSRRDQTAGQAQSFGYFVSGDYQFARRWFAGARYDQSGRPDEGLLVDKGTALLLTYWPSEFSQVRGEWRWTRYSEGQNAHEVFVQLLFSIGAHGAHPF